MCTRQQTAVTDVYSALHGCAAPLAFRVRAFACFFCDARFSRFNVDFGPFVWTFVACFGFSPFASPPPAFVHMYRILSLGSFLQAKAMAASV